MKSGSLPLRAAISRWIHAVVKIRRKLPVLIDQVFLEAACHTDCLFAHFSYQLFAIKGGYFHPCFRRLLSLPRRLRTMSSGDTATPDQLPEKRFSASLGRTLRKDVLQAAFAAGGITRQGKTRGWALHKGGCCFSY